MSRLEQLKHRLGYDDALDAFGVHGIGGVVGGILTGFFANDFVSGVPAKRGVFYGRGVQLGYQVPAARPSPAPRGVRRASRSRPRPPAPGPSISAPSLRLGQAFEPHPTPTPDPSSLKASPQPQPAARLPPWAKWARAISAAAICRRRGGGGVAAGWCRRPLQQTTPRCSNHPPPPPNWTLSRAAAPPRRRGRAPAFTCRPSSAAGAPSPGRRPTRRRAEGMGALMGWGVGRLGGSSCTASRSSPPGPLPCPPSSSTPSRPPWASASPVRRAASLRANPPPPTLFFWPGGGGGGG